MKCNWISSLKRMIEICKHFYSKGYTYIVHSYFRDWTYVNRSLNLTPPQLLSRRTVQY